MTVRVVCPRCGGEGEVPTGGTSPYVRNFETCPVCAGAKHFDADLADGEAERLREELT